MHFQRLSTEELSISKYMTAITDKKTTGKDDEGEDPRNEESY